MAGSYVASPPYEAMTASDPTANAVVDSTADYRWMVLPLRPAGTEGWDENRLASVVRAGDMIGVTQVRI